MSLKPPVITSLKYWKRAMRSKQKSKVLSRIMDSFYWNDTLGRQYIQADTILYLIHFITEKILNSTHNSYFYFFLYNDDVALHFNRLKPDLIKIFQC